MTANPTLSEDIEADARRDGVIDFKDEGEDSTGVPIGKLTLHSSGVPLFHGRWVTKQEALRLAQTWSVELFEY